MGVLPPQVSFYPNSLGGTLFYLAGTAKTASIRTGEHLMEDNLRNSGPTLESVFFDDIDNPYNQVVRL
jgi:hypothetical protein